MKQRKAILVFLSILCIVVFTLCNCDPGYIEITYTHEVNNIYSIIINDTSEHVDKNTDNPRVKFQGIVIDDDTQSAIAGVKLRMVGTDALEEYAITYPDGKWEIIASIVPNRNDENTTIFAIEVQKDGSITAPLSAYCKDPIVWSILRIQNPDEYQVAGAYMYSVTWEELYNDLEWPIHVKMKN